MLNFIELAVQGGAIALGAYSLWMIGSALKTNKDITDNRLKLFWSALTGAIIIVGGFLYLEVERSNRQEVDDTIREFIASASFDPVNGKYPFGTRTGLKPTVSDEQKFNTFNGTYIVNSLWADPRYPDSWVRANKITEGLLLEFMRFGYGVDVKIPPEDNQPIATTRFNKIVVTLQNPGNSEIAFRLRLVDERDTHWVWGVERNETQDSAKIAIDYAQEDSTHNVMSIPANKEGTFSFPLNKGGWVIFPNDGNAGLPNREGKFGAVQFVIIEPGLPNPDEGAKGEEHRKYLNSNSVSLKLVLKEIGFRK